MRRIVFVLLVGCCAPLAGCCSLNCCGLNEHICWGQAKDDCKCGCCTDGSESPRYKPPGPWWTRPDCGCPKNCRTYQEARRSVYEEAKFLQLQSATMTGIHLHGTPGVQYQQ